MSTFEELRKGKRPGGSLGCPVCGAKTAGGVLVNLREGATHAAGRSIQFCEEHATEVYLRLVQVLDESAGRS